MPLYPNDFKNYLKDTINIQDAIHFITGAVEPAGVSYIGKCPFHADENPSLMINPETKTWSCFGCGAGSKYHSKATSSDIYGFIMGYYNYNLGQAIEWLASFAGIPLPVLSPEQQYKQNGYNWWVEKCNLIHQRFQKNLIDNKDAYKYIRNRGIEDIDIINYSIGFGDGEDQEFMNTKGKITFAIHDYDGNIISFTGRVPFGSSALATLNEKEKADGKRVTPKYDHRWELNSEFVPPDYYATHPFKKFERNDYLYGINHAKNYIRQWGRVILVEGFTDVISLHTRGLYNAVATMGTNISQAHITQLKRAGAKHVLLMRDGDFAGLQAMERDSLALLPHGFKVQVCPLPDGHDPDSLAQTFPLLDEKLSKYINKRTRTLQEWRVEKVYKEKQEDMLYHTSQIIEIKTEQMQKVVEQLCLIEDPVDLDIHIRQYADVFNISYDSLREKVLLKSKGVVHS